MGHRRRRRDDRATPAPPRARAIPYPRLLAVLRRSSDPVTVPSLARDLGLDSEGETDLRRQLEFLGKEGVVFEQRRGRWKLHSRARLVIGKVSSPKRSYGFVSPEDGARGGDLYVAGRRMHGARHGDLVMARVIGGGRRSGTRESAGEGEVIAVLERRSPFVAGLFHGDEAGGVVVPRDSRVATGIEVGSPGPGVEDGAVVWTEIITPEDRFRPARGRVTEVFGVPGAPGVGEAVVERMFDLPRAFPAEVEADAGRYAPSVSAQDVEGREDFRESVVITVDPVDAKDHDDAVGLTILDSPGGPVYRLQVHIADVSRYVTEGSALDREALHRGVSVYFPGYNIPMLPRPLSSGICSLVAGEDRLTQSVVLDFDGRGRPIGHRFADGVIRSRARLTYLQVSDILSNHGVEGVEAEVVATLRDMERLCRLLRERRMARGSLDLQIPETEVVVDEQGRPVDVRPVEHDVSHQMIEEFMLAANETVATWLGGRLSPTLYRIHEEPDPAGIGEVEERLASMGVPVRRTRGGAASRLKSLLEAFRGRPEEQAVGMMVLRTLKLARYSRDAIGHFGLAAPLYTHFTSPIRRYPDLVVHRVLRRTRAPGWRPPSAGEDPGERLAVIADECSRLERQAAEAERTMVEWKEALFMQGHLGEEYHGAITGMTAESLFVTLEGLGIEGIVPDAPRPRGNRDARWRLGQTMRVRVQSADPFRGRIVLRPLSTG